MSVDPQFWHGRWEEGFTPWHQGRVNGCLERQFHRLGLAPDSLVLVPLCGKAVDMHWLAGKGCRVLGVELNEGAARAFFEDNGLGFETHEAGAFRVLQGERIRILVGDVFALDGAGFGEVDAVYDRGSLVALDDADRVRYANIIAEGLPPTSPQLVVTVEYDVSRMNGPPFCVDAQQMSSLFAGRFDIELLESGEVIDEEPRFRERGLDSLVEHAFLLSTKSS